MANGCPCDLALIVYGGIGLAVFSGTVIHGSYSQAKHPIANYDLMEDVVTGFLIGAVWPVIVALVLPLYGLCKGLAGVGRHFALRDKNREAIKVERQRVRTKIEAERQRVLTIPVEDLAAEIEET